MKKNVYGLFLCAVFLVLGLFYSLPFRKQQEISVEENRSLQKVPVFSFQKFAKGKFQNELENAISDQLLGAMKIKYGVKWIDNFLTTNFSNINPKSKKHFDDKELKIQEQENEKSYTYIEVVANKVISNNIYKLDDSGYLVNKPIPLENYCFEIYNTKMFAQITYPKYLFFVMSSRSVHFNEINDNKILEYIKAKMPMTDYEILSYKSFEEYKKYFYQTDHHWNYRGSYLGYTKIMKMLEGDDVKFLVPKATHTYDTVFHGSLDRDNLLEFANEKFTVYIFDIPKYVTYVNDVKKEYGYRSKYVSDTKFPHRKYENHYGLYYGDDQAKVVYDFNQPEKENILILGNSFTNSINELVASHYNKTHILDIRHFKRTYGYDIDVQTYMKKNNLSKVLIVSDIGGLAYEIKK